MFEFKKIKPNKFSAVEKILKNISLQDFIHRSGNPTDIIICPTYAIDINNNIIIQERCVSCALCWHKAKNYFAFSGKQDKDKFIEFCNNKKLFVYNWLSLVLEEYSGIEIVCSGYSRTKRIPLLILKDNILFIVKASHDERDLEKDYRTMEDIENILNKEVIKFSIEKISLLINDSKQPTRFTQSRDYTCLSLPKILDNLLFKGYSKLSEHIKFSRCPVFSAIVSSKRKFN